MRARTSAVRSSPRARRNGRRGRASNARPSFAAPQRGAQCVGQSNFCDRLPECRARGRAVASRTELSRNARRPARLFAVYAIRRSAKEKFTIISGQFCGTLVPAAIVWLVARSPRRIGFITIFSFPLEHFGPRRFPAGGLFSGATQNGRPGRYPGRAGAGPGPPISGCAQPRRIAAPCRGSRDPSSSRPFP